MYLNVTEISAVIRQENGELEVEEGVHFASEWWAKLSYMSIKYYRG